MKIQKFKKKKISKRLKKYLIKNDLVSIYNALQFASSTNNYFDFSNSDNTKIGYLKGSRIPKESHLLFDKIYRKNNAYHSKLGKLTKDISLQDSQKLASLLNYKSLKNDYNLFLTSDICKYYLGSNYFNENGILGKSCMKSESNQSSIKFYENIGSDIVELLVLTNKDDKVLGRALLWKNVYSKKLNENIKYLDRIYVSSDNYLHFFENYMEENNIKQSFNTNFDSLEMQLSIDDDIPLPFFDTFTHYSYDSLNTDTGIALDSVCGDYLSELENSQNENMTTCEECGIDFDSENEGTYTDNNECLCDNCYTVCENGNCYNTNNCIEVDSKWYHQDDDCIVFCDYDNTYYLLDDAVFSDYHKGYLNVDDTVFSEIEDAYFHKDDINNYIIKVNKDYYLKESVDIVYCKLDDKYILVEDCEFSKIENTYFHINDVNDTFFLIDNEYYHMDNEKIIYHNNEYILKQLSFL